VQIHKHYKKHEPNNVQYTLIEKISIIDLFHYRINPGDLAQNPQIPALDLGDGGPLLPEIFFHVYKPIYQIVSLVLSVTHLLSGLGLLHGPILKLAHGQFLLVIFGIRIISE
jgi:hypothetical protein